jgi:hypothetical protein
MSNILDSAERKHDLYMQLVKSKIEYEKFFKSKFIQ